MIKMRFRRASYNSSSGETVYAPVSSGFALRHDLVDSNYLRRYRGKWWRIRSVANGNSVYRILSLNPTLKSHQAESCTEYSSENAIADIVIDWDAWLQLSHPGKPPEDLVLELIPVGWTIVYIWPVLVASTNDRVTRLVNYLAILGAVSILLQIAELLFGTLGPLIP